MNCLVSLVARVASELEYGEKMCFLRYSFSEGKETFTATISQAQVILEENKELHAVTAELAICKAAKTHLREQLQV